MTRSYSAAALVAAAGLAVVGCSAGVTTPSPSDPVTEVSQPTPSARTAPEVAVDGVSATDDTINVGVLADLTGPFSSGVVDVLDAQLAFWTDLNDRGGIGGRRVEVKVEDTAYDTTRHVRAYHRLVDEVVMFSHSTGTAQTEAIADLLVADHRVAIPLTWYSGWATEPLGTNLIEIGSNYCVEAVNTLGYLATRDAEPLQLAVVTAPGDFGGDSAAGLMAASGRLGVEIVFDGSGTLGAGADLVAVATAIAESGADWTWLSTDPSTAIQLVATASQLGYQGAWTGSSPTWNTRLLATQLGPLLGETVVVPTLVAPLGARVEGMELVYSVLAGHLPDRYPSEAMTVGYLEFEATRRVLEAATDNGDLTPQGVEAVAQDLVGAGFGGISPAAADADRVVTATGVGRLSFDTFSSQDGLSARLGDDAVTPIQPIAGFDTYAAEAGLDYEVVCSMRD